MKYEEKVWKIEEIRRAPRMRNFVLLIENEDEEDCLRTYSFLISTDLGSFKDNYLF